MRPMCDTGLLLTDTNSSGIFGAPLEVVAQNGYLMEVARELIQEHGIECFDSANGGVDALSVAAENDHVERVGMLIGAGEVDSGFAVMTCAQCGRESSV